MKEICHEALPMFTSLQDTGLMCVMGTEFDSDKVKRCRADVKNDKGCFCCFYHLDQKP